MIHRLGISLGAMLFGFVACVHESSARRSTTTPHETTPHESLDAILWVQTSSEYRASCLQAYSQARRNLDAALADPLWHAVTPADGNTDKPKSAVILDVDETVLDNSPYQASLVHANDVYGPTTWNPWVHKRACEPVPGALEFCKYTASRGVTVFYVTNRRDILAESTAANLRAHGFPNPDAVLAKTGESSKEARRQTVASAHRVLLTIGDNIFDFADGEFTTGDPRWAKFGREWIMLPNPMYGGWESAVRAGLRGGAAIERKRAALR